MLPENPVKVLVVGGGGREHAICWKLAQSPRLEKLYCAPGNGGTAALHKTENVDLKVNDFAGIEKFSRENHIDLIVIGPDNPLADGIVDHLEAAGLRAFGPTKAGAQLEASKAFSKNFMVQHGIPTARHYISSSHDDAMDFVRENDWARVVKVDGLALGKGVFVCDTVTETLDALQIIFRENRFGDSGKSVVIEERLQGEEISVLMFCDGKTLALMPPSQDHKRRFDGDRGPNTGGMGVFAPVELYSRCQQEVQNEVVAPLQKALDAGSINFKGILYAGVLVVREGSNAEDNGSHKHSSPWQSHLKPYVLEFNARFGDPETQVILPLLSSDLLPILWACTEKDLANQQIEWSQSAACCVIACADNYPEGSSKGEEIKIGDTKSTIIFHAGTTLSDNKLLSAGGRVVGVTALGNNLNDAIDRAYEGIKAVSFKGMDYRKDIGRRALSGCP
jgi:phosphoribosylamine--glycine ligase